MNGKKTLGSVLAKAVDHRLVLAGYGCLTWFNKTGRARREAHFRENRERALGDLPFFEPGRFIENQKQWQEIPFGKGKTMQYAGCGVIATYNALLALGERADWHTLTQVIRFYEKKGAALGGYLGIAPTAVRRYFARRGYRTTLVTASNPKAWDRLGERSEVLIAVIYNDKNDLLQGMHFVCVTKENGAYAIHNVYHLQQGHYRERGGYESVSQAVRQMSAAAPAPLCILGIGKAEKKKEKKKVL